MNLYLVIYEHRHGCDTWTFRSDISITTLRELYTRRSEEFAKIIGIDNYEPDDGEQYSIEQLMPEDAEFISEADITTALVTSALIDEE